MKSSAFPQWKGFELSPEGCLLEQVIDLEGEMGFAYERCCQYYKDFHTHDRQMFIFSRGSSVMDVRTSKPKKTFRASADNVLLVPKDLDHDDEGKTAIYDTMALYPSQALLRKVATKIKIPLAELEKLESGCLQIKRSKRLVQLAQDFFIGKVLARESQDPEELEYLAKQIVAEVLSAVFPKNNSIAETKKKNLEEESLALRAIRFIEANLFEPLELAQIAKNSGGSISTLLRKFKEEVETTPYSYIKGRRLEEAMRLLQRGGHNVGDVALLVGYENFGAFSEAFKEKFGQSPSDFKG
ncbi:MAG: helix-turn-helix transcriptional regulator [Bdellovibrionota bacterium]